MKWILLRTEKIFWSEEYFFSFRKRQKKSKKAMRTRLYRSEWTNNRFSMIFHASCFPIQWFRWAIEWNIIKFYQKPPNSNDEGTDVISNVIESNPCNGQFFFYLTFTLLCSKFIWFFLSFISYKLIFWAILNTSVWKTYALFKSR